jgi:replicative DNA helicase
MNAAANDDTFKPENLPTTDEAFGSSINDENASDDDGDVPF